jgi:VWFA-related protein
VKTLLLALALLQQSSTPYLETLEVRINNVDVVVTDRAGKAVTGLRKEDFVVLEDGKPQTVTNFAAYAESAGAINVPAAPAVPAAEAAPRTVRRFVFFVDEMALHPVTRRKLVASAKQLMQTAMQPGDEAMILTPAGKTKIVIPFTSDRQAVGAALERVIAAADSRAYTQEAAELRYLETEVARIRNEKEARAVMMAYADSVRRRVEQRLGQLRGIVSGMSEISGKKVVVLVASSFPSTPGKDVVDQLWQSAWGMPQVGREYYDLTPRIEEVARTAAANGVTIYSLQPAYGMPDVIGGPDIGRVRGGGGAPRDWQSDLTQNELTFNTFADATGGKYLRGDASVPTMFQQIATDVTTYYSLGYRATEQDTDKPHRIEVRLKDRPELRVRARRDVMRKSPAKEMEDLTVAALLRRGVNELGIGAETGALAHDGRLVVIPVIVHLPLKNLTFLPTENGVQHATFRVHFAALGERADFAAGEDREQAIDIPAADFEKARGQYFTYETRLRVGAGKYRIAVGVFDPLSRLAGFRTLEVEAK